LTHARPPRLPVPAAAAAAVLALVTVALGYLGRVLLVPGGSLAVPASIVGAIGGAVAALGWMVTRSRATAAAALAPAVIASEWTFSFALPVSMAWDGGATPQARADLRHLASSPRSRFGIPLHPCTTVGAGHVGSIDAPYRACSVGTPEGHVVVFTAAGRSTRGIAYTDIGSATFPDACARHLTGNWWMFTQDGGGTGRCPIGYGFHGGG